MLRVVSGGASGCKLAGNSAASKPTANHNMHVTDVLLLLLKCNCDGQSELL